jgi:scyllo-inositol 2-dehydrogenase (NADP+)
MSSPIVTGLLSYGMSGRVFHAPFLTTHPGFTLKAVVERNQKKMAEHYPKVISYNSVDELLNDAEIDLVVVNTPSQLHYEHAKQALQAGKHVLVEKPASANLPEVLDLFELARQANRRIFVYQNRRWDSDFLSVKEVVESGRLGKLIEVHFRYDRYKPVLSPKPFKETTEVPTSGLVYDLGPHLIDQAISLFGQPLSWHKVTGIHRDGSEVPDYFSIQLSYPHQLRVFLTSSLLVAQPLPSFVVHGTAGSYLKDRVDVQEAQLDKGILPTDASYGLEPEGSEGQLVTIDINHQKQIEKIPARKGNYTHLFDAVYQTLSTGALYPITEEHIAWQIELLQA